MPPPPPYPSVNLSQEAKAIGTHIQRIANSPQAAQAFATLKKKAEQFASDGKLDEAKHTVAKALQLTPHDKTLVKDVARLSIDKAKQFENSQDFDKAIRYARQSLAFDGTSADARKMLDGLLEKTGINATSAADRIKNAELLASQGRSDEAAVEYQAALRLKPSADAHIGLGNLAWKAGQKDKAKAEYQEAIEVEPTTAAGHRQLGALKYAQSDIVAANAELSRALILDPHDKQAAKTLVELWQRQVSQVPGSNSHLGLARAYQLAGDLSSAQTEYRTVAQADPNNPHLPACRQSFKLALARQEADKAVEAAHTLETQGALPEAYQKVYEAVGLSPGDADLRVYQGHILEKLNRFESAKQAYMNALKVDPHNLLAAARLKALPTQAPPPLAPAISGSAGSLGSAGSAGSAGPFVAPPPLSATAGSALPLAVTHDPVANISNFAYALRNHMVTQKTQLQKIEDAAHQMIRTIGGGSPTELSLASDGVSAAGGISASSSIGATGIGASNDPLAGSVSGALSSAASAIAAAKGGAPSATPPITASPGFDASTSAPVAGAATTAAAAGSSSDLLNAMPKADGAYKKLMVLQKKNEQLQQQVQKMSQALKKARTGGQSNGASDSSSASTADPGLNDAPPLAPPISTNRISDAPAVAPSFSQSALDYPVDPAALKPMLPVGYDPLASNPINTSAPAQSAPPQPAPPQPVAGAMTPATVRLELQGADPQVTGVELSVLLLNDSDHPLMLPKNMRAIIKYNNRRDAEVKPVFKESFVPSHGQLRGVIRIPFDKVDPTADLLLPGLLPPGSSSRDLHLTTSMASR